MTIANSFAAKLAVAFVAIAMMVSVAAPAKAASDTDLQAQIDALMATIAALQAQLGIAGDASASSSDVCPYTWTRSLSMGDTGSDVMKLQQFLNSDPATQVAVSGAGSPGNETEYYGPATGAAVAKFQEMYRADILSPLGLVNSTTFFGPSTRAKANALCVAPAMDDAADDATDSTDDAADDSTMDDGPTLGNGEGSIDSVSGTSPDESNLEEGTEGGVLAFDVEIEGDVEINRIDVYAEADDGLSYSDNADDYFTEASLWVDGDKVATVDVNDFDTDNYSVVANGANADEEYRIRFSGLDLVFADGDDPEFQVAFKVVNNLDSADLAGDWNLTMNSIRYVDGEGFTDTDTTVVTDSFGFDAEEVAELKISTSANDPEASVLEVEADDRSGEIEVFVFEIEEKNGVDVTVEDLSVTITTIGTANQSVVVDEAILYNGSTELGAESVPNGGVVTFENIGLDIDADETVELTVKLVFNQTQDYNEGDQVSVAITSTDIVDAVDANGNDEVDMTRSGSATSETHELRSTGITVAVTSADTAVTVDDGPVAGNPDTVTFTWNLDITAFGDDDVYVTSDFANIVSALAGADDVEMAYAIEVSTGSSTTGNSGTITSAADEVAGAGSAYTGENFFRIDSGTTETFTVVVTGTNQTNSKQIQAYLTAIEWTTDDVVTGVATGSENINAYTFELADDSQTGFESIN